MNILRSFLGRRQFLIAAGVTSALGLGCKKLARVFDTGIKPGDAVASGMPVTRGTEAITNKYHHLLSPLRVRNVVLKNRILHTPSPPHLLQGPENFPADAYRNHYSDMAKNAAVVTIVEHWGEYPKTYDPQARTAGKHHSDHIWEDIPPVHNYIQRMIEDIHCEGSLVSGASIGGVMGGPGGQGREGDPVKIEDIVTQAKQIEDMGYDIVGIGGQLSNTDDARAAIEQMQAVRKATNLLIMAFIRPLSPGLSRPEPPTPGIHTWPLPSGPKLEEVVAIAKVIEGSADILRMKDAGHATSHPNISYFLEVTPKSISGGKVIYVDAEGDEKSIQADSVVIYAGFKPRMDEAMKFTGSAGQVFLLGDCTGKNGTIQKSIRSAFFVASQV